MTLTRRTLLSLPVAVPLLNLAARVAVSDALYFPPPDSKGGWRTLQNSNEIRTRTGIDTDRLDEAFQYVQTTSQHGGLLVVRHGYLVYEKYFGRAHRDANPNMYSIGKMFTSAACGIMLSEHDQPLSRRTGAEGVHPGISARSLSPERPAYGRHSTRQLTHHDIGHPGCGLRRAGQETVATAGHLTAIVHGENVDLPYWISPDPVHDQVQDQDGSALHGKMWTAPGEGYLYSRDPHIASIVLRRVVGMELQEYLNQKLANRWDGADGGTQPIGPTEICRTLPAKAALLSIPPTHCASAICCSSRAVGRTGSWSRSHTLNSSAGRLPSIRILRLACNLK